MASGLCSFGSGVELMAVENKVMDIQVPDYARNFLSGFETAGFSKMIQLHGAIYYPVRMSGPHFIRTKSKVHLLAVSFLFLPSSCCEHLPVLFSIIHGLFGNAVGTSGNVAPRYRNVVNHGLGSKRMKVIMP